MKRSALHLLIGILRDGSSSALHALEQLHVSPETLRAEVERVLSEEEVSFIATSR